MYYYNRLAPSWHLAAGRDGGPLKSLVLNDMLLDALLPFEGHTVLELGAGNGYLTPLILARFPGAKPEKMLVSDQCRPMVDLARRHFPAEGVEYQVVDMGHFLPMPDASVDQVIADMVLHELGTGTLRRALMEIRRVLKPGGQFIGSFYHSRYVEALRRQRKLGKAPGGALLIPGPGGLFTPIVERPPQAYHTAFAQWGEMSVTFQSVMVPPDFFEDTLDLELPLRLPVALVFKGTLHPGGAGALEDDL